MSGKRAALADKNVSARLGYAFRDRALLAQALTHGSSPRTKATYQRLEFLGDRVLSLVIAEALYNEPGRQSEGRLAARHSALVRGEQCAEVAERLRLAELLQVGASERKQGLQHLRSVLADVIEAVIGAIYLDGGLEAARQFVLRNWASAMKSPASAVKDPKTFVQEWALARGKKLPAYEVISRSGPDHKPEFLVRLNVQECRAALGKGASKQQAEKQAAVAFIAENKLR